MPKQFGLTVRRKQITQIVKMDAYAQLQIIYAKPRDGVALLFNKLLLNFFFRVEYYRNTLLVVQ
jgi:hypothetical protein